MKHKHPLTDATHILEGFNASCGDKITIFVKLEKDRIIDISFSGDGCLLSQVSAEMLADELQGKSIDTVLDTSLDTHLQYIGIHPTPSRMKCVALSLSTLKQSLKKQA